jgi:hypothetical protein
LSSSFRLTFTARSSGKNVETDLAEIYFFYIRQGMWLADLTGPQPISAARSELLASVLARTPDRG